VPIRIPITQPEPRLGNSSWFRNKTSKLLRHGAPVTPGLDMKHWIWIEAKQTFAGLTAIIFAGIR
jgi:hypothetical protein